MLGQKNSVETWKEDDSMRRREIKAERYHLESEKEGFVDVSSLFGSLYFCYVNICGPEGTGKSTLLSALRCYYDEGLKTGDLFTNSDVWKEGWRHWEKGQHPVIDLDFSDFAATTMEGARAYFRARISDLYLRKLDRCGGYLRYYYSCGKYLDFIEGTEDEDALTRSLQEMVRAIKWRRGREPRPLILIDELGRTLLYAQQYGYLNEMRAFLDRFLEIDHYEEDIGIVTTSYAPANVEVNYHLKYIGDEPVNKFKPLAEISRRNGIELEPCLKRNDWYWDSRYLGKSINLQGCFEEMMSGNEVPENNQAVIHLDESVQRNIQRKRRWIQEECRQAEEARKRSEEESRKEYAAPLPKDCLIPSVFAGVRNLDMPAANSQKLAELNSFLVSLYDEFGENVTQEEVYEAMQGLEKKEEHCPRTQLEGMIEELREDPEWELNLDVDTYWERFDCERGDQYRHNDMTLIKVYLTAKDECQTGDLFCQVVRFLAQKGKERFHAKVARQRRKDQICLWVTREDFFLLEHDVKAMEDQFIPALMLIPYRGKMGISREFFTWNSHSGVQATMISAYLKSVGDRSRISLPDMLREYVRAWNGDLDEEHALSRAFKSSNAQELIVLLESIHCILGNAEITDDHILLSDSSNLWRALGDSKNWYEVGVHWARRFSGGV